MDERERELAETAVGAALVETVTGLSDPARADTAIGETVTDLESIGPGDRATDLEDTLFGESDSGGTLGPAASPREARQLLVARVALLGLAAAAITNIGYFIVRFVASTDPPRLHAAFRGVSDRVDSAQLGETLAVLGGVESTLARLLLVSILLWIVPLVIAVRHRRNPMVHGLAAITLSSGQFSLAVAVLTSSETGVAPRALAVFFFVALPAAGMTVAALFPSGRAVPRWALRVVPVAMLPFVGQAVHMVSHRGYSMVMGAGCVGVAAVYVGFIWYRYRGASLRQRNQIKWLAYGGASFVGIQAVAVGVVLPLLGQGTGAVDALLKLLYEVLLGAAYLVGMTIGLLSAARYRLWDIDRIVNRTLVYAVLTVVLIAVLLVVYAGLELGLQRFSRASNEAAVIVALLVAAGAFAPIRRRITRWIDRRVYGIGVDYEALARKAVRQTLPTTGREFAAYDELELLGRGGMGAVYRAHHPEYKMPVALKVMSPELADDAEAQARFRREASILQGLRHPNVVRFLASGHERGLAFIAMEFVGGEDLGAMLRRRGRLTPEEVMAVLGGVASALDAAHDLSIVHRDIKPSNILVEATPGSGLDAMVMDFGVALWDEGAPYDVSEPDEIIGSLPYIAPEQIRQAGSVDGRADVYALGVTAFELLTGTRPFRHDSPLGMVMAHLNQPAPDPRSVVPALPRGVAAAVLRALAKVPAQRFASAGAFVAAMRDGMSAAPAA